MHRSKCKGFSSNKQGQWKKELNLNLTPTQIGRKFLFSSQSGACIDTHSYVFIWQCISVHHQIHHHVFSTPDTVAYVSSTEILKEIKTLKFIHEFDWKCQGKSGLYTNWLVVTQKINVKRSLAPLVFILKKGIQFQVTFIYFFSRLLLSMISNLMNWIAYSW